MNCQVSKNWLNSYEPFKPFIHVTYKFLWYVIKKEKQYQVRKEIPIEKIWTIMTMQTSMGISHSLSSTDNTQSMDRDRSLIVCHHCRLSIDYDEIVFAKKCVRCSNFYHRDCFGDIASSATCVHCSFILVSISMFKPQKYRKMILPSAFHQRRNLN